MQIIGHRGARGLAPENTIVSLRKALEHHVDMIEFDLRVTKDDMVILHHDPVLTDPDGQKLGIAEHNFDELKQHKPDLATFKEALKLLTTRTPLYIEVKPNVPIKPIVKILKDSPLKNYWLASFSQPILRELQKELPDIPKVVIEKWSGVRAGRRARQLKTNLVCMNQKWLWWGFIKAFSKDHELYTYTLNDPKKARRWQKYGLAGVVTDFPDRFENW